MGLSRRDFIRRLSAWVAASAGILVSLSLLRQFIPRRTAHRKRYRIGRKNDFPLNAFTFLSERQLYVYRDHEGIRAVSAVCTHLGCTLEKTQAGFLCPCHGSCYDRDGKVLSGAAKGSLPWYSLDLEADGQILVNQAKRVDPSQKLLF